MERWEGDDEGEEADQEDLPPLEEWDERPEPHACGQAECTARRARLHEILPPDAPFWRLRTKQQRLLLHYLLLPYCSTDRILLSVPARRAQS